MGKFYRTRDPKEEQNHVDYSLSSISCLVYSGSDGQVYGQAVRSMILARTVELGLTDKSHVDCNFKPPESQPI
jgi:hypothetical protein